MKHMHRIIRESISPAFKYTLYEVESNREKADRVSLGGGVVFRGRGIALAMSGADIAALFAVTLGWTIEQHIKERFSTSTADAYILDTLASVAAESLAHQVHGDIASRAKEWGFFVGHRYSPGYCDWSLSEQKELFTLLHPEEIGIELNDSYMMSPRKSITAIVGLGKDRETIEKSPCATCPREDCMAKRFGEPF
jgi:hypothetical protein